MSNAEAQAKSSGWVVGIEFIGAVLISGLIGWAIDNYAALGTGPWAMIVLLILGLAAAAWRAMKMLRQFADDPDSRE